MAKTKTPSIYYLAEQVAALPLADADRANISVWAPQIINIFRGTGLFMIYDEHWRDMDDASGGRFWMTRSVRNSPVWGPKLTEADNERPVRTPKTQRQTDKLQLPSD